MSLFFFYIFIFSIFTMFFNFLVTAPLNRVTWSRGAIEMVLLLLLYFYLWVSGRKKGFLACVKSNVHVAHLWIPSLNQIMLPVVGDALVAARTVRARDGAHRPSCSMKAMNLGRSTHSWSILRLLSTPRVSALNQSPTLK